MQIKITAAWAKVLLAFIVLAAALMMTTNAAVAQTTSKTLSMGLPDSRPLFLTVDVNGEEAEAVNRPGAKDAFLTITVSGTQVTDLFLAPSTKCEGTTVDQRAAVTLGGDDADVTITRTFKPVDPETGAVGEETTETLVNISLGPGPKNTAGIDFCG